MKRRLTIPPSYQLALLYSVTCCFCGGSGLMGPSPAMFEGFNRGEGLCVHCNGRLFFWIDLDKHEAIAEDYGKFFERANQSWLKKYPRWTTPPALTLLQFKPLRPIASGADTKLPKKYCTVASKT